MDLKEIKKITAYARKAGIKSLKFGDVEIEFADPAPFVKQDLKAVEDIHTKPAPTPEPTLDQINAYIYSVTEEVG